MKNRSKFHPNVLQFAMKESPGGIKKMDTFTPRMFTLSLDSPVSKIKICVWVNW